MKPTEAVKVGGLAACLYGYFLWGFNKCKWTGTTFTRQRGAMLVQCVLVGGWLTVFVVVGGHWYLVHFLMFFFFLPLVIVGMWRKLSSACQSWGNLWRSNNAFVLSSLDWWKSPIIMGIIKTVRDSSPDGFQPPTLMWDLYSSLSQTVFQDYHTNRRITTL